MPPLLRLEPTLASLRGLLAAQGLGVFNEYLYKMIVAMLAVHHALHGSAGSGVLPLVSAVFLLPCLLYSGAAGRAVDMYIYRKCTVLMVAKAWEVFVAVLAWGALYTGRLDVMLGVLAAFVLQSMFFRSSSYIDLPELLPAEACVRAKRWLGMSMLLAMILGSAVGSALFVVWQQRLWMVGPVLVAVALLGAAASWTIPARRLPTAQKACSRNLWPALARGMTALARQTPLRRTVIGIAWFWLLVALMQLAVSRSGTEVMGLDNFRVGMLGTYLTLGIGLGSLVAGRLAGSRVELGLIALGAMGMGGSMLLLAYVTPSYLVAAAVLFLWGLASGWFLVPLQALLRQNSPQEECGLLVATTNVLSMGAVLVGLGLFWVLRDVCQLRADHLLGLVGCGTLIGTGYVLYLLPHGFVRFILWLLTHTLYRIRVVGQEHMPLQGPALLVCNHVSYIDGLLLGACVPRFVRFLIYKPIYESPLFHWLFRLLKAIPIAGGAEAPAAIEQARQALQQGHVVCIFAEGAITRTGNLLRFRRGFEKIMEQVDAPVIPIHLDRLWGSIFSFHGGRFLWKRPRRLPSPVTVSFGAPMPATTTAHQARQAILELSSVAAVQQRQRRSVLPLHFLKMAKRRWSSFCMADTTGAVLTYGQAVTRSLILARWIRQRLPHDTRLGIYLPPSVSGALVHLAVLLAGKVPIAVDTLKDHGACATVLEQCGIKTVVTLRHRSCGVSSLGSAAVVSLDEGLATPSAWQHVWSRCLILLLPLRFLRVLWHMPTMQANDLATVIFSRGTTGTPKGVMLSHHNILANIEGLSQIFELRQHDRLVGILPFGHAFGCTVTLWFPLLTGCGVLYADDAGDLQAVEHLVQHYHGTVLLSTPAWYAAVLQAGVPTAFASLRYAMSGAEALDPELADAFKRACGVDILAGYGLAELSPVVSVNIRDVHHGRERQVGYKPGTVGHPLPGVAVKVIHPTTHAPLGVNAEGLLLVHGPNGMLGYVGQHALTAQVVRDGWYMTGDLAAVDEDGFIRIVGRLTT